ncbi:MAG: chemotaxis protein CheX [Planctomycetaceae bacterium]
MLTAPSLHADLTAEFVNPILVSTRTVFQTMLECTPRRSGLFIKESMIPRYEISAMIGITGKAAGTIVLSLSRRAALEILNRLVGVKADEIDRDVCDAVGEVTNMIAGQAKSQMEHLEASLSIPSIVSGVDHTIYFPSNVQPICILFDSEIGPFAIEVGFTEMHDPGL